VYSLVLFSIRVIHVWTKLYFLKKFIFRFRLAGTINFLAEIQCGRKPSHCVTICVPATFMTRHGRGPAGRHRMHVNNRNYAATIFRIISCRHSVLLSLNKTQFTTNNKKITTIYFFPNVSISTVRDVIHSFI